MGAYVGAATAILLKKWFFDPRGIPVRLVFERDRTLADAATPPADGPSLLERASIAFLRRRPRDTGPKD
jgi:hypothetical protein